MNVNRPFKQTCSMIHTVAIYGHFVPLTFKGRLVFKEYNDGSTRDELMRTNELAVDTIFYETDKVMRQLAKDAFGDARDLYVAHFALLKDPYRIVYNRKEIGRASCRERV